MKEYLSLNPSNLYDVDDDQIVYWMRNSDYSALVQVSPNYEFMWQHTIEELFTRPISWYEKLRVQDPESATIDLVSRNMTDEPHINVYQINKKNGATTWVRDHVFPVFINGHRMATVGFAVHVNDPLYKPSVTNPKHAEVAKLSLREMQCCRLLVEGKTSKEAADQMNISPKTYEWHIMNIKKKVGCKNKADLISLIIKYRLVYSFEKDIKIIG